MKREQQAMEVKTTRYEKINKLSMKREQQAMELKQLASKR